MVILVTWYFGSEVLCRISHISSVNLPSPRPSSWSALLLKMLAACFVRFLFSLSYPNSSSKRLIAVRYQTKTNELPYSVSASSLVQPAMSNISDFSDFDHDCVSIWSELEGRGIVVHSAASAFATLWFLDGKANFLTQNYYA